MAFPVGNIRRYCKAKGITLAELERKLGIGNGVIARWEKAKASPPIDRLTAIAEELDTTIDELCKEEEIPASTKASGVEVNPRYYELSESERAAVDALIDHYATTHRSDD